MINFSHMKIDFSQTIKDLDGNEVKDEKGQTMTLGRVTASAVLSIFPDERDLDVTEKMKRNELAEKVWKGGEVDLSIEELASAKKLINKAFATRIVAQSAKMLEGQATSA